MDLPKPNTGFGFFFSPRHCKYPFERQYFEHMRDRGMNTFAPFASPLLPEDDDGSPAEHIARQLNLAAEVGLLDPRFPVTCCAIDASDLIDAQELRDDGLEWPDLRVQFDEEVVLRTKPDPDIDRYRFGCWAFKHSSITNLVWAYSDGEFSRAEETEDGPEDTEGMLALSEGITDYRMLQALSDIDMRGPQELVQKVMAQTMIEFWPDGFSEDYERQASQIPPIDFDEFRERGMYWLQKYDGRLELLKSRR